MKSNKFRVILTMLILPFNSTMGQTGVTSASSISMAPEIGKPMPNFELSNVQYYNKKKVTLDDFKGKWLFLDFWFKGCTACINSFPKVNKYQEKFEGKINYLLVGKNDSKENFAIEELYRTLKEKHKLNLPVAFDSILARKWDIFSMPHIFIIDPNGIVQAITDGRDLNESKIQDLIDNKAPLIYDKSKSRKVFGDQIFKENVNDSSILIKSSLAKYKDEIGTYAPIDLFINHPKIKVKGYRVSGVALKTLYFISELGFDPFFLDLKDSLYGQYYTLPILNIKDSTDFKAGRPTDFAPGYYNYSLVVNKNLANKKTMMNIMKSDLKNNFGYQTHLEKRKVEVWKLIALPDAASTLKTKGETMYQSDSLSGFGSIGFTLRNVPITDLLARIKYYSKSFIPFINETGILSNIDIEIDALMTNINEIKKALRKNNLDLIKEEKELTCLIINEKIVLQ